MNDAESIFLENLYHEKYDDLFRLARLHLRDAERAEEIVQDTFVSAQLRMDELIKSPNPGGLLYGILINKIKNERRARQRYVNLQMVLSQQYAAETQVTESENDSSTILSVLTEEEYKLLTLIYNDGYKIQEAAGILDINYEACRKRIYLARRKLHKFRK